MKLIHTEDAVGHVLCHDITRIVKGVVKEAAFRKGHVVGPEDIPVLLALGKDHLYVYEVDANTLHEDDAAAILAHICAGDAQNMTLTPVKEGKIEVVAACDGLLTVDVDGLRRINALGEMMIATRHTHFPVRAGDKLAGTRIIPLIIPTQRMEAAKAAAPGPLLSLKPYKPKKVGIVTTGNEVFHGRIEDTFTPVVVEKVAEYGGTLFDHVILDDDGEKITAAITDMVDRGAEMVLCTGGMSVDPDDKTPLAIRNTGAEVVSYGAPVLPGAMFLVAYLKGVPVMGLPGCVMYERRTIFDLILPRAMADVKVTADDLSALGHGGLCLGCEACVYPNCSFGKSV